MVLDDIEQQLSVESFCYTPIDLSRELLRRDELSELIADMTKTLHVNTPELTMRSIESDVLSEKVDSKQQHLIGQLQTQLVQNRMQRTQQRNYSRILHQSNTPAYWYKTPPVSRSVYFYDPNYQKVIQRRTKSPPKIKPNLRITQSKIFNQSSSSSMLTPRTKYMIDLYQTAINYKTKPHVSQRNLNSTLPPIHSSKRQNENI